MAGQFGTNNKIVGFKAEGTVGTYNAPIAADFNIEFFEASMIEWDRGFNRQGKAANGNLTMPQSKSGRVVGSLTGKTRLHYSGDETTAPNVAKLLTAAGLVQSGGTTVPIVYTYSGLMPCSTLSAVSTDFNCGSSPTSIEKRMRGIQADLVISAAGVGQEITLDWTLNGAYEGELNGTSSIQELTGIDTGATEKLEGTVFSFGGVTYIINSFSLALGNTVSPVLDPSKTGYVSNFKITGTDAKLTVQVQKFDPTTSSIPTDILSDEVFTALSIAGTHWDIDITDCNLVSDKDADAEGIINNDLEFEVRAFTLTQKD